MDSDLLNHFRILPDPRRVNHNTRRHELLDIIIITILAVICGADTWVDIETFGRQKEALLKQFLSLPHDIPSHDTFARVFSILNPDAFNACFVQWVERVREKMHGEIVAIDGKTVRRAHRKDGKPPHTRPVSPKGAVHSMQCSVYAAPRVEESPGVVPPVPQWVGDSHMFMTFLHSSKRRYMERLSFEGNNLPRRVFYPMCSATEIAAGWRDTTSTLHPCQRK